MRLKTPRLQDMNQMRILKLPKRLSPGDPDMEECLSQQSV